MTIVELIEPLDVLERYGDLNAEALDITDDSRRVQHGSLFVAVKGAHVDGHAFLDSALAKGAVGVVLEEPLQGRTGTVRTPDREHDRSAPSIAMVRVNSSRRALGMLAARLYEDPSRKLQMVGVTGTNGKTTVTHVSKALLDAAGKKTGLLGTVGYIIRSEQYPATHTTPGAVELQALLAKMVASGVDSAILEVSSHALALDRVAGCEFDIVVFTNLTQDHLDFHTDMEDYFQAKLRLFTECVRGGTKTGPKRAIVNVDDERGRRLVERTVIPVWTYSIRVASDIQAQEIHLSLDRTEFMAVTPLGRIPIESRLVGESNVYNMLAAIGVGLQAGLSPDTIQAGLRSVKNVPGRFERVDVGQDFTVLVDYAHTEDALVRLLKTVAAFNPRRLIVVFGCGGDRDSGKRPHMGRAAVMYSDLAILTSDNPRSEDPMAILQDIESGVLKVPEGSRAQYRIIADRSEAIQTAVREAQQGDMVLIAGKGHEDYQLIGERRLPFDDREVARQAILDLLTSL